MIRVKKRLVTNIVSPLVTILLIFLIFSPYLFNNYNFFVGFDAGYYMYESEKYIENYSLKDSFSFWSEPGLFILVKVLYQFIPSIKVDFFIILLSYLLVLPIMGYLILNRLTNNRNTSILGAILILLSYIQINSVYLFILRQLYSSLALLIFLYFFRDFYKKELKVSEIVLLVVLSSLILFTHRAISLIWAVFIVSNVIYFLAKKEKYKALLLSLIFFATIIILSPYLLPILKRELLVLSDFVHNSYNNLFTDINSKQNLGIDVTRSNQGTNPIVSYILSSGMLIIFYTCGMINFVKNYFRDKNKFYYVILIPFITLIILVFLKSTFANRFLVNLDFFLVLFGAISVYNILRNSKKTFKITLVFILVVLISFSTSKNLSEKKPYLTGDLNGIYFIENNIDKSSSIFIAADYMQTILSQEGYLTPITLRSLKNIKPEDELFDLSISDNFLIEGYSNVTFLEKYYFKDKDVYILLTGWDLKNKLPRATINESISLDKWDESRYYEVIYKGDTNIVRIYKLK